MKNRGKSWMMFVVIAVLLLVTMGCSKGQEANQKETQSTTYEYTVRKGPLIETVDVSGQVVADESYEVKSLVSGIVKEVYVEEGDKVKAGDVLVELEDEDYQLNYLRALQNYELAKAEGSELFIKQRELELAIASRNLERTKIRSPIDGVVISVEVKKGEPVGSSRVVAQIVNVDSVHVEGAVDEVDYGKLEVGQRAVITLENLSNMKAIGTLSYVSSVARTSGGLTVFPIKVDIQKRSGMEKVVPGLSCDISVMVVNKTDVITVPVNAILRDPKGGYVVKVKSGEEIEERPVEVGYVGDFVAEITSGLEEGEIVVIDKNAASSFLQGGLNWDRQKLLQKFPSGSAPNPMKFLGR
ncbi:MAG: hypothetical protein DRP27_02460 [Thermotogae bacterium]|nr:MAG: hypothetical protein DRP27_02460 [Thermotogota bacterium]